MSYSPYCAPNDEPIDADALLLKLRRKEGTWVDWGQACAQLQKAGYLPDRIFEETGFEPVQQNQVMVAFQVYGSLLKGELGEAERSHFTQKGSDLLYEFRILTQPARVAAAQFSLTHHLDADQAHELAKAMKDFSRLNPIPEGFTDHPGDAIAYSCWKSARQQKDIQERSRLIAKGLRYVHSGSAREHLQHLLTDFTVVPQKVAPRLPLYRLESADECPRTIPVVGTLPLTLEDWKAVPPITAADPFGRVRSTGAAAFVAVPGWSVLRSATDLVAIVAQSNQLPQGVSNRVETVLILLDRDRREWNGDRYFLVAHQGELELQWWENQPEISLLAELILIVRPPHFFDRESAQELWQIEE